MAASPTPLVQALLAAAEAVVAGAGELNRLDGYAGDGDLGITMAQAAQAMKRVLKDTGDTGPSQQLSACGAAVAREAPSTSGTLVATGLLRAAKALPIDPSDGVAILLLCFTAAMEGIQARGKASVGDRTLVDGLDAVCSNLARSAQEGLGTQQALHSAAGAAASAAEASASMEPKVGRASWMAERAAGHPDAGCAMLAIAMKAAAEAVGGGEGPTGPAQAQ
jgi:dihydroxyacetone kinase